MNTLILFEQLLVLAAMAAVGFLAFRLKWIDQPSASKVTTLVVKIFNPMMIISSTIGRSSGSSSRLLLQNFILTLVYFAVLTLAGFLYVRYRRFDPGSSNLYMLLTVFSNLGFMGIPLVKALYGDDYIIYLVFYLMVFNVIAYTFGIRLAVGISDGEAHFRPDMLFNTGMASCIISVLLFVLKIPVAAPIASFCSYVGNMAIPLSMMIIGVTLAQTSWKDLFTPSDCRFIFFKMLLLPVICSLLIRLFPVEEHLRTLFCLMVSMPAASLTGMLAEEYAGRGHECNRLVILTTIVSVITIPLVSLI